MAMTEFAKEYHEKMLPGHTSTLQVTDPEFIERFDNFAFDEVVGYPRTLNALRCINDAAAQN